MMMIISDACLVAGQARGSYCIYVYIFIYRQYLIATTTITKLQWNAFFKKKQNFLSALVRTRI
jgi:hypothetical protein